MKEKLPLDIIGLIAFSILLFSQISMFFKIEPFYTWFYLFAWWSYIVIIDSIIFKLKGNSLIRSRGKEIIFLAVWSTIFWFIFESINLILQNWYYVNLPVDTFLRRSSIILAFATVLPCLFETAELLEYSDIYSKLSIKRFKLSVYLIVTLFVVGILFILLSITFPQFFFPLVWGSFLLILEPILYLSGGRSLLKDLEKGYPRKILILLTSGLICGFLWEFWNYWAYSKWMYTLPYLNQVKIFEMPIAGFLGFPLFAVECYVMYNFISFFRKDAGWEKDTTNCSYYALPESVTAIILSVVLCGFSYIGLILMEKHTIDSYESHIEDIPYMTAKVHTYFSDKGLIKVYEFIRYCKKPENIKKISTELNYPTRIIQKWVNFAKLIDFKGIGSSNFLVLQKAGIESISDLAKADPIILHKKFKGTKPFGRVNLWISEAQELAESY